MYKYSLDKSSKKFVCPSCGKKTFVRYVNVENNSYLEDGFGRCDRQTNCQYHSSPKQNNVTTEFVSPIIKRKVSTLQYDLIVQCGRNFKENNFVQFLKIYFTPEEVQSVILKYLLGTSSHWNGSTVFWQINQKEEIQAGKVMLYDAKLGKRVKKPFNHIHWVHKLLKLEDFVLHQCLFGLHLVSESSNKKIAIVESEKTVLIMSLFLPDYIWMATGSKANFKKDLLLPLKNHSILVYPDKSEYDDWNKKVIDMQKDGFKISCSRFIEDKNVSEGTDLADIYLDSITNNKPVKVQKQLTKTEIEVNRLAKINPEIINLIKTFDLLDNEHNEIVNIDL